MAHLATNNFAGTWQISTVLFVEYGIYRKREKEALRVELCKILIPRDSHELLYLVSVLAVGMDGLRNFSVESGTNFQAGYAIPKRRHVVGRDFRIKSRFSLSNFLSDHHVIAEMIC